MMLGVVGGSPGKAGTWWTGPYPGLGDSTSGDQHVLHVRLWRLLMLFCHNYFL